MRTTRNLLATLLILLGATAVQAQPITLVTLGDSLTKGDGDTEGSGGYPARVLKKLEAAHTGSSLTNLAQSGMTTDDLLEAQLEPAIEHLGKAPPGGSKLALVWIGSNDLFGLYNFVCDEQYPGDYDTCEHESEVIFSDNINTILSSLQGSGAKVFIALLDDQSKRPVMTDKLLRQSAFDRFTAEEVPRMAAQITKYNAVIRKIATRLGVGIVDFSTSTLFQNAATLDRDGNHPNSVGYDQIAEAWHQAIASASTAPAPDGAAPLAMPDPVPDGDPEDAPNKANEVANDTTAEPSLEPAPSNGAKNGKVPAPN